MKRVIAYAAIIVAYCHKILSELFQVEDFQHLCKANSEGENHGEVKSNNDVAQTNLKF